MSDDVQPEGPAVPGATRWRRKTTEVQAIQWTGENFSAVEVFAYPGMVKIGPNGTLDILLSYGWAHLRGGSWVAREDRALFASDGKSFAHNYEPLSAAEPSRAESPAPVPDRTAAASTGPAEALPVAAALDREGLSEIVKAVVADFTRQPGPALRDRITDALWPLLEHAQAAAAGSHEGVRLWMLDCGELVAKHRARAEAATAELTGLRSMLEGGPAGAAARRRALAITGTGEEADHG